MYISQKEEGREGGREGGLMKHNAKMSTACTYVRTYVHVHTVLALVDLKIGQKIYNVTTISCIVS